jgi:hypothetical protein
MRTLFRIEGVAATFDLEHIKRHYYQSHRKLKPSSIVPVGPEFAFMSEPQRNRRISADNERPETSVYVRFAPWNETARAVGRWADGTAKRIAQRGVLS